MDVAEVNQWLWLEESGQLFENVDQTHLVLASGKQVLQKINRYLLFLGFKPMPAASDIPRISPI